MKKLTFVDASVLIAAARGQTEQAARAFSILGDPDREFVASTFLRLEVMPRAMFNQRDAETAFYQAFFAGVARWVTDLEAILEQGFLESSRYGVEAMDALHVAAAALAGATELVTAEKPSRSLHRARAVRIVSIFPSVS